MIFTPSDELKLQGCFSHLESSSAELLNAKATYFLPPFMMFTGVADNNGSTPQIINLHPGMGVSLKVTKFQ